MALKREDQFIIHAGVQGVNLPKTFSWSEMDDGFIEAQDTKIWPGGMQPQRNLGGPTTRSDVTVKRPYSTALHPYIVQLENVAGRATAHASYTPQDANGNPDGPTVTIHGILKGVQVSGRNAANAGTGAYLVLVIGANAEASIAQG